ncbi:MAG TPA: Tm-1-like ATP-binding domain-containing protein [Plantibacter sp.]|uniref:Tm-1-like ATP-binding domain-containing protein n=1 Tax=unclassified Plantibacter TaxID=2624265 RepID=UPI002D16A933|nr:Tm-1-like ATP-binding domain-containing protein [Plantibacter sp.]
MTTTQAAEPRPTPGTPTSRTGRPVVVLVGTLDTKGVEYQWVADRLDASGAEVIVVDAGTRPPEGFTSRIDHPSAELAAAAGTDLQTLLAASDRGAAVTAMAEGAAVVVGRLHAAGRLDAVLALGGSGGSAIAARAVRDLPVGTPKLIVSTMASGDVSPYVGASDVTLMYSVVDIAGVNQVSRAVLGNAAAAVVGMAAAAKARADETAHDDRPLIGASMFGVTTPAVDAARGRLDELGYEVLVFHATGSGGQALESLARSGMLAGVLDLTTTELADDLVGGVLTAGPDRLTAAGASGVPQLVSLGALDMVNFGPRDTVPDRFTDREFFVHNATVTLMRTTEDENRELGTRIGSKLAAATAPTILLVPRGGVSALDADGLPFHDPIADSALIDAVLAEVEGSAVTVIDRPEHINDPAFAILAADTLHALVGANTGTIGTGTTGHSTTDLGTDKD